MATDGLELLRAKRDHHLAEQKRRAEMFPVLLDALRDAISSLGGINSDAVPDTVRDAIAKAEEVK
jgi:hypothetical protein